MIKAKKTDPLQFLFWVITMIVIPLDVSLADSRSQFIKAFHSNQSENNEAQFVSNGIAMMSNISTQMQTKGYGLDVVGSGPDANYGLGECYGDLSLLDCEFCFASARTLIASFYPNNGARVFFDGCFLRSENYSFFQEYTGPQDTVICNNTTRKDSSFQDSAKRSLFKAVSSMSKGYGRSQVHVHGRKNESAYVLVNCWNTLGVDHCKACLEIASLSIMGCFPWSEGRALYTGCFIRYSDIDFLNPIPKSGSFRGTKVIITFAALSAAFLVISAIILGLYFMNRRRILKKRKGSSDVENMAKIMKDRNLNFKYSTLKKATNSFDISNKLGQGGFGTIYKGILPDGRVIAVKKLLVNKKHDFYNEINIISSLDHKNLVRLLGCSCSGPESLLVYEFLPNKSLDRFIFNPYKERTLEWKERVEIITGIAEGLDYLHENSTIRIVHRDIKASNILLDSKFRPKIADFGLARSFQIDKSHISTSIAGTLGYMSPEYLARGQLTEKADVYSFGVLLLEIVTGKKNSKYKTTEYTDSLVTIAWKHFLHRSVKDMIDPSLMLYNYHKYSVRNEVQRVVHVGLLCTQHIPSLRPTMSTALIMLVNKEEHLPLPTKPPFLDFNTMELNYNLDDPTRLIEYRDEDSVAMVSDTSFSTR